MRILEINFCHVIASAGGAERVFCNMANEFNMRGHDVVAVCLEDKAGYPFYPLNKEVKFYNLQTMGKRIIPPKWRKVSREILRILGKNGFDDPCGRYIYTEAANRLLKIIKDANPDIAICYDINSLQLLQKMHLNNIKVVFMLHMDAVTFLRGKTKKEIAALKQADVIQALMPKDKEFLNEKLKMDIEVIPNIVPKMSANQHEKVQRENVIVNIGRLDKKQKQQHLLIDAFSRIAPEYPEWKIEFYGDTFTKNYRNELENQIKRNNLNGKVKLMGVTNDSKAVLKKAAIFAFPSAYEGFPLALTEAMAAGLPCIGLKSCLAVSQLVEDNKTGILTDQSVGKIAIALERLIRDEKLRVRLGMNAEKSMEAYAPGKIWDQWEELLNYLLNNNVST